MNMRMHRTLSGVTVTAIVAALLWWLLRAIATPQGPAIEPSISDSTRRELVELRSGLDDLRATTLRAARERPAMRPDTPGSLGEHIVPSPQLPPKPSPQRSPAPTPEERARDRAEIAAQIDIKFAAEQLDPAW